MSFSIFGWKVLSPDDQVIAEDTLSKLHDQVTDLQIKLDKYNPNPKEDYFNNKYPKSSIKYQGRPVLTQTNNVGLDLRNFFNEFDADVKAVVESLKLNDLSDDAKALACLKWIIQNFNYVSDGTKGKTEFWQFAFESLFFKTGDCEDGAILLANMLLVAGVPYWKVRVTAGLVQDPTDATGTKSVGHAFVNYYCEDQDKWTVLDWCYWPSTKAIKDRPEYKDEGKYKDVWFSFNQRYSFTQGLNHDGDEFLKK